MKIETLLKSKGFTDQEITDMAPMLNNARFRANLEEELTRAETLTTENAKLTQDLNGYDKWFTTEITPDYLKLQKEREDAVADAAAANARLKLLQERGMRQQGQNQDPAAIAEADRVAKEAADKARLAGQPGPKYVEEATFHSVFERTGEAIAGAVNISRQHEKLFPGVDLDMEALYGEAKAAKLPVKAYWEAKFKVAEKRAELTAASAAAHDAKIRSDERQKVILEGGGGSNPNTRTLMPSVNPWVLRPNGDEKGKQPWETPDAERNQNRVTKAYTRAVGRGEI